MKKIYYSLMAIAIAAFTFTACEDVPEPYNNPYNQIKPSEPEEVIEPTGSGTKADPWNVAALIEKTTAANLADGDFLNGGAEVYVKGIVTETTDISAQYGNATYYISDDAKGSNRFYVYRGKLLDGAAVEKDTDLQVGDEVTVCGKVKNYKGTMEFDQGNYLVAFKKGEGGDTPVATPGTEEKPLTVAEALTYIDGLGADKQSPEGFVKGKIVAISEIDTGSYGNATYTISDDGKDANTLQIYRGYSLGGEKFKSADEIKVGDEVVVNGKLVNYKGNTKQFAQGSKIVLLNGKKAGEGNNTGNVETMGKGTATDPYNVPGAIAAASGTGVYVKAFIVGSIDGKATSDAKFSNQTATASNILIAATADETDVTKCMPVQLPTGDVRTALNLVDNAGNYKKEVTLYGNIEKYFGITGLKSVTFAILDGKQIGTSPEGGNETPSGDKGTTMENPYNIAEALAAINALEDNGYSEKEVYVKGLVVKVTTNQTNFEKYGNLNYLISEDGTENNTITVYSGDGLNGAKFSGIDALSTGDEVIVYGKLQKYVKNDKVTPEIAKGNYLVSLKSAGGNETPSNSTGTFDNPLTASQAYTAVAAMEKGVTSEADYYVKGKITSIKYEFSADYGTATFNFSDDGNASDKEFCAYSTYYFGSEQKWVEGNTQVKVGDEVIVCGKVVNYNGNTPEFASKKSYVVKINNQTSASRRN